MPLSIGTREIESLLLNQEIQQSLSESSMEQNKSEIRAYLRQQNLDISFSGMNIVYKIIEYE